MKKAYFDILFKVFLAIAISYFLFLLAKISDKGIVQHHTFITNEKPKEQKAEVENIETSEIVLIGEPIPKNLVSAPKKEVKEGEATQKLFELEGQDYDLSSYKGLNEYVNGLKKSKKKNTAAYQQVFNQYGKQLGYDNIDDFSIAVGVKRIRKASFLNSPVSYENTAKK